MQRLEVEPGQAAGVSGGVLAGQGKVAHAAEHLPIGGPGDGRLGRVQRPESGGGQSLAGEPVGDERRHECAGGT